MPLINLGTLPGDGTGDNRRYAGQKLNAFNPLILKSISLTAPPVSPSTNDRYVVVSPATGDWAGQEGKIACYQQSFWTGSEWDENGGWMFFNSDTGMIATLETDVSVLRFDGTDWLEILPAGGIPTSSLLSTDDRDKFNGIEESADANMSESELTVFVENLIPESSSELTGSSKLWNTSAPPEGWLEEDGSAVSRSIYAALFLEIGTTYGTGDGSTTFNLPDSRGLFLRGWDHGAGNDPDAASRTDRGDGTTGDNVGTLQTDALQGHWHEFYASNSSGSTTGTSGGRNGAGYSSGIDFVQDMVTDGSNGGPRVSSETRPANISKMVIIKY